MKLSKTSRKTCSNTHTHKNYASVERESEKNTIIRDGISNDGRKRERKCSLRQYLECFHCVCICLSTGFVYVKMQAKNMNRTEIAVNAHIFLNNVIKWFHILAGKPLISNEVCFFFGIQILSNNCQVSSLRLFFGKNSRVSRLTSTFPKLLSVQILDLTAN